MIISRKITVRKLKEDLWLNQQRIRRRIQIQIRILDRYEQYQYSQYCELYWSNSFKKYIAFSLCSTRLRANSWQDLVLSEIAPYLVQQVSGVLPHSTAMSVAVTHRSPNSKEKDLGHVLSTDRTVPVCQCVFKNLDVFPSILQIKHIFSACFQVPANIFFRFQNLPQNVPVKHLKVPKCQILVIFIP